MFLCYSSHLTTLWARRGLMRKGQITNILILLCQDNSCPMLGKSALYKLLARLCKPSALEAAFDFLLCDQLCGGWFLKLQSTFCRKRKKVKRKKKRKKVNEREPGENACDCPHVYCMRRSEVITGCHPILYHAPPCFFETESLTEPGAYQTG